MDNDELYRNLTEMQNPRMFRAHDGTLRCGVPKAYRGLSDIGSHEKCHNPVKTERGYCLRHDPLLGPQRDKYGRIIPKETK